MNISGGEGGPIANIVRLDVNEKCKFVCAKITALHIQLAFEGKGVGVKSVVILLGADTSPQHKTNKQKSKYCFWGEWDERCPVKQRT